MAKQIKAIKCPHCGSVDKTKLDKDLYHCESCNTDYFLDNDDININVTNTTVENKVDFTNKIKNKIWIGGGVIFALVLITNVISIITSKPSAPKYGTYSGGSSTPTTPVKQPTKPNIVENKPLNYSQQNKLYYTFINKDNQLMSFGVHYRSFDYKHTSLNGFYYEIRDVLSGKLLKKEKLQATNNNDEWDFRRFNSLDSGNNITYIVHDNETVYAFDERNLTFSDVTQTLFKDHPEFVSGIATVNLAPWGYEDCFYVLTNNGKEYFFYPSLNKIYDDRNDANELRAYFRQLDERRSKADKPYEKTVYDFKSFNNESPILIKVVYQTRNITDLESYGFRSTDNNEKPYKIHLQYGEGPIIDDRILVKDRLFFNPSIVYSTKDTLIIRVKNNASPNAFYNLQSLDTNTGEVKWTVKGDENRDFWSQSSSSGKLEVQSKYNLSARKIFIPYLDGYLIQMDYGHYILIANNGEMTKIDYQPELVYANKSN